MRAGKATTLVSYNAFQAVIDAAGRTVAYSAYDPQAHASTIHIYRIDEQSDELLAAGPDASTPILSADGARVMFLLSASSAKQIWTVNSDGSALQQVTHDASGVLQAAMSDDGRVAWYLSGSGHVVQVNLDTGEWVDRVAAPLQFSVRRLVLGSAVTISGTSFSDGFLRAVFPAAAIARRGQRDDWGHLCYDNRGRAYRSHCLGTLGSPDGEPAE